uniref:Uncharacterized protein n=1 Tax=Moniliophthora roreri TaxID=221103 RepID=A0A0W0GE72_MONRR
MGASYACITFKVHCTIANGTMYYY